MIIVIIITDIIMNWMARHESNNQIWMDTKRDENETADLFWQVFLNDDVMILVVSFFSWLVVLRPRHLGSLSLSLLFIEFFDGLDFLLEFHPPVLEPDFDLSFSQTQGVSHFNSSSSGQVVVRMELLLQLKGLVSGVGLSTPSSQTVCSCQAFICPC
jgi:hypothetical protein